MEEVTLIAFRAPEHPSLCEEFIVEHMKVLEDFGISNVTKSNGDWHLDPGCFVIVAMHPLLGMVGGIRLQLDHEGSKLPMELAVGQQDPKVGELLTGIRALGNGEVCSLWNANRYANRGVPVLLSQAVTAISYPAGMTRMVCLVAPYTKRHPSNNGFVIVEEVGDKGVFAYPRPDFQGIVMLNPDTHLLSYAHPLQRAVLMSLRVRPEQTRTEQPGRVPLEVHYRLRVQADERNMEAFRQIDEERKRNIALTA
ncbi:MAG: hypothetical protein IPN44_04355 [Flavobacteriales bacterium]|nr:hypothetical protein [Flavobacteriales bacterium]